MHEQHVSEMQIVIFCTGAGADVGLLEQNSWEVFPIKMFKDPVIFGVNGFPIKYILLWVIISMFPYKNTFISYDINLLLTQTFPFKHISL